MSSTDNTSYALCMVIGARVLVVVLSFFFLFFSTGIYGDEDTDCPMARVLSFEAFSIGGSVHVGGCWNERNAPLRDRPLPGPSQNETKMKNWE